MGERRSIESAAAVVAAVFVVSACSQARQNVQPVPKLDPARVCIVENAKTRVEFRDGYRRALERKGYEVDVLPEGTPLSACPVTSKYVAHWNWDIVFYLTYAEILVYRNSERIGGAVYTGDKFIDADDKIRELVDLLFRQ